MKKYLNRIAIFAITFVSFMMSMLPISVVYAADHEEAIISQQATTIERDQIVKDVVVLGHDVTVSGHIPEILVVVDGDIYLAGTSRTGIAVDLGGTIHQERGAHVNAVYHASMSTPFWNGVFFGALSTILLWVGMLAVDMGLALLSVLICFAFRHQISTPLSHIEHSVRRVGMTGVFMSLTALAISAIFAITILLLPLTGLLLFLYVLAGVIGLAIVSLWVGKRATRNSSTERPTWMLALIGSCLIMAFTNIPVVGLLLFCIFWLVGIGTVTIWLADVWRNRRSRRNHA